MSVEIKICGLRDPVQAAACAAAGADAIGLVFYPPSPRHVSLETARAVLKALPASAVPVAVCVNMRCGDIMRLCDQTGIRWVQCHGAETPDLIKRLASAGLRVIKSLKATGTDPRAMAGRYEAAGALLIECASGPLPGGNGRAWDWAAARALSGTGLPLVLAGGLRPENVAGAIDASGCDAVDVSSGVEKRPGEKSLLKVRAFVRAVRTQAASGKPGQPLFSK